MTRLTKKHRVLVAGCGGMSHIWVDYALSRSDTEIVGLVDLNLEAADALASRKGLSCPRYTDLREAILQTDATLVFDVTIPASHYVIGKTAMEMGCHVFAEKPLAESLSQCLDLLKLSRENGKIHAVMQNRRFDPNIRALRRLVGEGTIGRPGFIGADFFIGPHFGGFRDAMDSPLLLDMAIHTFDQARYILGADPVSVYCHEFNPPGSWYAGNAMAVCIFEMSDGSVFNYRGSWCAEGASTSWESSWRITGEFGTALWDGQGEPYAEIVAEGGSADRFIRETKRVAAVPVNMALTGHQACLANMFDALETGARPETDCSDNIHSIAMVLGAVESARSGNKVHFAEFMRNGWA